MIIIYTTVRSALVIVFSMVLITCYAQQPLGTQFEELFTLLNSTKNNQSTALQAHYHALLYAQLVQRNDAAQYQRYITMFANSVYTPAVTQHLHDVLYTYSKNYDAVRSLKKYAVRYPLSIHAKEALLQYDALIFDSYKLNYSIPSLKKFITENPLNSLLPVAYTKLYAMYITSWGTYNGSAKYVHELPNATNISMAWNTMFNAYDFNYDADSITLFEQNNGAYAGTININEARTLALSTLLPAQDTTTKLWGYMNETGKWIITPQYLATEPFAEGYAVVETVNGSNYINKKNEKMLPTDVDEANAYSHGMAVITSGGKDGALNRLFSTVIPCTFMYLNNYNGMYMKAQNEYGLYGTINSDAEWVVQPTHSTLQSLNTVINEPNSTKENSLLINELCNFELIATIQTNYLWLAQQGKKTWYNALTKTYIIPHY